MGLGLEPLCASEPGANQIIGIGQKSPGGGPVGSARPASEGGCPGAAEAIARVSVEFLSGLCRPRKSSGVVDLREGAGVGRKSELAGAAAGLPEICGGGGDTRLGGQSVGAVGRW